MTANDSKFHLSYLDKYVDQYNNSYHHSVHKKPINADYSALTETSRFKVNDRVRINNIFSKGCIEDWSTGTFIIDFVLKTNPWI